MKATRLFQRTQQQTSVFDKKVELRIPKIKKPNFKKPAPAWTSALVGVLVLVLATNLIAFTPTQYAQGAYTSSTTDADGNTHLGNNSVNDTYAYDTTQDSSPETQQQLGVDPNWRQGVTRKSYALRFDGSNDYVDMGTPASLVFSTTDNYTIEAWIKTSAAPGSGQYQTVAGRGVLAVEAGYGLVIDDSLAGMSGGTRAAYAICFQARTAATYSDACSNFAINDGLWHHVAGVRNSATNTSYIFVDGALAGTDITALSAGTDAASKFGLGMRYNQAGPTWAYPYAAGGLIDEVRVSNTLRYTGSYTPQRRFIEDSYTKGLWHLDEGTGTSTSDSSMYNTSGTLTNGPIWTTGANAIMDGYDGSKGYQNKSGAGNITLSDRSTNASDKQFELRTTGSSGLTLSSASQTSVTMSDATSTINIGTGNATIETWLKTTSDNGSGAVYLYSEYGSGSSHASIYLINNRAGVYIRDTDADSTSATDSSGSALNDGAWHHIAGVLDATNLTLYVDGMRVSSSTRASATGGSNNGLGTITLPSNGAPTLGHLSGSRGTQQYNGMLDEFRFSTTNRYTANFTPSRRFATDANTSLLFHFDEGAGTSTLSDSSGNGTNGSMLGFSSSSWGEGLASTASGSSSQNWALPNYAYRQRINAATTTALSAGHAIESTINRGTTLDNKQTRPDGKDWRVQYQPSDPYRSLSFDNGDTVTVPDSSSLNLGTSDFTIEAWVKGSSMANSDVIVAKTNGGSASSSYGYLLGVFDSLNPTLYFATSATHTKVQGATSLRNGQWYHIAVVVDRDSSTNTKMFVNGKEDNTTVTSLSSNTGSLTNTVPFVFGSESDGGFNWEGSIDEVRVSNSIRYTGNFSPSTTPFISDSNTQGLWHIDEASGQIIVDSSSNQNNGALGATSSSSTDDPTWLTGTTADGAVSTSQEVPRFLPHGHSLYFDGNDYASLGSIAGSSVATSEVWIKPDGTDYSSSQSIMGAANSLGNGYSSRFYIAAKNTGNCPSGDWATFLGSSTTSPDTYQAVCSGEVYNSTNFPSTSWTHLAVTYDGSTIRMYRNGRLVKSTTQTVDSGTSSQSFSIGRGGAYDGFYFKGQMDEVRISNVVRYQAGGFTPQTAPFAKDGNTLALLHLDENSSSVTDQVGTLGGTNGTATWVTNGGKVDSTNQTQFKIVTPVGSSSTSKDYYLYYGAPNEQGAPQSYNSYALTFDGTDDGFTVADASSLDPGDTNLGNGFTVSTWFKSGTSSSEFKPIIAKSSAGVGWGLYKGTDCKNGTTGTTYCFFMGTGSTSRAERTATARADTNWHHIVVTVTPQGGGLQPDFTIYVDGTDDTYSVPDTGGSLGTIDTTNSLFIAKDSGSRFTSASIDETRIYKRVLTATEVAALYSNTPAVSNSTISALWRFDDATVNGTTVADSIGNNTGTLSSFNFNGSSNWIVNKNLKSVATEPTQTSLVTEQESPTFFEWRDASSSWPTDRTQVFQLGTGEQQLGSNTVYVKFNPMGAYSRQDYYRINSWAIEAYSTTNPRGRLRAFPDKTNLIATASGLDIIDASTNKLWMRFNLGTFTMLGATNAPNTVTARDGRIYIGSANGIYALQLDLDNAHKWSSSGNSSYGHPIAERNATATNAYGTAGGSRCAASSTNSIATNVVSNKAYIAAATTSGMCVLFNATGFDANNLGTNSSTDDGKGAVDFYDTASTNQYTEVALTSGGELYGFNDTTNEVQRYNDVHDVTYNDTEVDSTPDYDWGVTTTPAQPIFRSASVNDIFVSEGTSTAEDNNNTLTIAHDLGVDVIQEHSTIGSGTAKYYSRQANGGASNWSSKNFGTAIHQDGGLSPSGTSEIITGTLPSIASYPLTVEMWIKPEDTTSRQMFEMRTAANALTFSLQTTTNNRLRVYTFNKYDVSSDNAITTNEWNHVVISRGSSGSGVMYVNGTQVGTISSGTDALVSTVYKFGPTDGASWKGEIDEARVVTSQIYTGDFTPSTTELTAVTNTALLLHFNEGVGQTAYDSSGGSRDGTFGANTSVGADDPRWINPVIAGSSSKVTATGVSIPTNGGTAMNFDGTNDFLELNGTDLYEDQAQGSISAWVNVGGAGTNRPIFTSTVTNANRVFSFGIDTNNRAYVQVYSDAGVNDALEGTTTTITAGTWYHVVVTNTGAPSGWKMYVNGTSQTLSAIAGSNAGRWLSYFATNSSNNVLRIGRLQYAQGDSYMNGKADDIRIYNRELSAAEVGSLYTSKSPFGVSNGLIGHWRMNIGSYKTISSTPRLTIEDQSTSGYHARSYDGTSDGNGITAGPSFVTSSPVKEGRVLWTGTNGASNDDGAMTAISLDTDRQIQSYTTSSGLPDLDITTLSLSKGGLALVGTEVGAWNPGTAGFVVDDTSATVATANNPVRIKAGTTRIKAGTTHIKPI